MDILSLYIKLLLVIFILHYHVNYIKDQRNYLYKRNIFIIFFERGYLSDNTSVLRNDSLIVLSYIFYKIRK